MKKTNMRRFPGVLLCLILAAATLLSFVACNGTGGGNGYRAQRRNRQQRNKPR